METVIVYNQASVLGEGPHDQGTRANDGRLTRLLPQLYQKIATEHV